MTIQHSVLRLALVAALLAGFALLALSRLPLPAARAAESGAVTGQVVWCVPLPVRQVVPAYPGLEGETMPGEEAAPSEGIVPESLPAQPAPPVPPELAPEIAPDGSVYPAPRPRLIPAGAVLVAVQGTNLSARTDESGRFRIEGVPTGQYLIVAAGPLRGVTSAVALRPNVLLESAGQSLDLGLLSLGQPCGYGPLPYGAAE